MIKESKDYINDIRKQIPAQRGIKAKDLLHYTNKREVPVSPESGMQVWLDAIPHYIPLEMWIKMLQESSDIKLHYLPKTKWVYTTAMSWIRESGVPH